MKREDERSIGIQPVALKDGKEIPGLFAFFSLSRSPAITKDINVFNINKERQKKLKQITKAAK